MGELFFALKLNLHLVPPTNGLDLHVGIKCKPHLSSRTLEGLGDGPPVDRLSLAVVRKERCEGFCLTDR